MMAIDGYTILTAHLCTCIAWSNQGVASFQVVIRMQRQSRANMHGLGYYSNLHLIQNHVLRYAHAVTRAHTVLDPSCVVPGVPATACGADKTKKRFVACDNDQRSTTTDESTQIFFNCGTLCPLKAAATTTSRRAFHICLEQNGHTFRQHHHDVTRRRERVELYV